jgi:hypothetical protein
VRRSRRAVLSACGAGLAALAGCSDVDVLDRGHEPEYDTDRLVAVGEASVPTPPSAFPVAVPHGMVERHRDRALELVERVPEDPDVPNGVVADRLREDRERVLEDLGEAGEGDDPSDDHHNGEPGDPVDRPLERLNEARSVRERAGEVEAAYRAATGDVAGGAIAERRERLRADMLEFERDWTYRGDDPASALVVHRWLETLRRAVRRGTEPERAFPDDPAAGVFSVGDIVGDLEAGQAALSDADRLRVTYREGLSDPRQYRAAFPVATRRMKFHSREGLHRVDSLDPEEPPFDRSIEGAAAGRVYRDAAHAVEYRREDVHEARDRGDLADALVAAGITLASLRALDSIVAAIDERELDDPDDAEDVAAARQQAVDALETAWTTAPTVLAVELARPAYHYLRDGTDYLRGHFHHDDDDPDARDARRAYASFVRAVHYAEAVPETVADLQGMLVDVAE